MIHFIIPIFISFVVAIVIREYLPLLNKILCIIGLFFILLCCMALSDAAEYFIKIPYTSVTFEESVEVGKEGVFLLESSYAPQLPSQFIMTDNFDEDELSKWLDSTVKGTYIYIREGNKTLWSYNVGLTNSDDTQWFIDYYTNWRATGKALKEKTRYQFLCFYIDV